MECMQTPGFDICGMTSDSSLEGDKDREDSRVRGEAAYDTTRSFVPAEKGGRGCTLCLFDDEYGMNFEQPLTDSRTVPKRKVFIC